MRSRSIKGCSKSAPHVAHFTYGWQSHFLMVEFPANRQRFAGNSNQASHQPGPLAATDWCVIS
jgi:hypothetical protein